MGGVESELSDRLWLELSLGQPKNIGNPKAKLETIPGYFIIIVSEQFRQNVDVLN